MRLLRRPLLAGAALLVVGAAAAAGSLAAAQGPSTRRSPSPPEALLRVSSTVPAAGTEVQPDGTLTIDFNRPLAPTWPPPTLDPPVAGSWLASGPSALVFEPSAGMPPGVTETVEVPGGPRGILGADRSFLPGTVSLTVAVAPMSVLRTQELLAQLGYLPLTFTPAGTPAGTGPPADQMALDQPGTFSWKWTTMPAAFTSLWSQGQPNPITEGAVMAFEAQVHLATDGVAGPQVWNALLQAVAAGEHDTDPDYDWVDVSTTVPESVTVWRNGVPVYTTPANTGIEAAPTEVGTWPVYARYTSTTMSGTNPDGSHYDDPGVPWVSYFHGGDALHGFVRSSYGTPQSLGCVEMPPANAAVVYPLTPLGTLVTIEPAGAPPNPTGPTTLASA
jgi:peptidoglycan hydrolase-like protein with peptidoglycan-binding domain